MSNVPKSGYRGIPIRPERWRYLLQNNLLALYREWPPYENRVLATLRPLWRRLESRYGWNKHTDLSTVEFEAEDQAWREEDDGVPVDNDVQLYLAAVNETVTTVMGLTRHGEAAAWAGTYVHIDAVSPSPVGTAIGPAYADFPVWERVGIILHVTEDGARIEREDHAGDSHEDMSIQAPFMTSFAAWDSLRTAVHEIVDQEIDRMRQSFESGYTSNYTARLRRNLDDLPELRAALSATPRNRPFHDDATWKRLDRLAALLDLDPPRH